MYFLDIIKASEFFATVFKEMEWEWNCTKGIPDVFDINGFLSNLVFDLKNHDCKFIISGRLSVYKVGNDVVYGLDPKYNFVYYLYKESQAEIAMENNISVNDLYIYDNRVQSRVNLTLGDWMYGYEETDYGIFKSSFK